MEGNDRITVRLEPEILARMEALLAKGSRYGSRSHLCRMAVRRLLEAEEGHSTRVTAEVPKAYLEFIDALVKSGYFASREEAVERLVKEGLSDDRVRALLGHQETMGRAAGKLFPVKLEERDEARGA